MIRRRCAWLIAILAMAAVAARADDPKPVSALDPDQLAARMKHNGDAYRQIRDQSLATYAKLHPTASPFDDDARNAIRFAVYLNVFGDGYREGIWDVEKKLYNKAMSVGAKDPLLEAIPVFVQGTKAPTSDSVALVMVTHADELAAAGYPADFTFLYYRIALKLLFSAKHENRLEDPKSADAIPGVINKTANMYGELVKAHRDPAGLFESAHYVLHDLQSDGDLLTQAAIALDQAIAQTDPASPLRDGVKGEYYTTFAWTARSNAYANKVTPEGWKLFAERLQLAADILEKAYAAHPESGYLAREMLTVELGQGQGRERMNLWFDRAIKADPDDFAAYRAKIYYLEPKWYGSDDDIWNFGVESAATKNYAARIPLVLIDAAVGQMKQHPEWFADSQKWPVLESTLRGFLEQYPRSNYYRSVLARFACEGQHWAVAEEQFKILGDNWDRFVFPNQRYTEFRALADKNTAATP